MLDSQVSAKHIVTFEGINKRFGGVVALRDVSFSITQGTIHALVGENGAGKSTLMKCLAGVHRADEGKIVFDGAVIAPATPAAARAIGIDVVFQEIELAPNLTVAQSIFLAREPIRFGGIDSRRMEREAVRLLESLAISIDPWVPVESLRTAEKQGIQIARALAHGARLLVMDEPTSSLSDFEVERLIGLLEKLRDNGTTILYVSHKLNEVFRLADDITVMRDGRHVETRPTKQFTTDSVIAAMVGTANALADPALTGGAETAVGATRFGSQKHVDPAQQPRLSVKNLTRAGAFRDVSFDLSPGEILGIFGIVGAGRTELVRVLFGLDKADSGDIALDGIAAHWKSPGQAIAAGLALVPENRKLQGLLLEESLRRNVTLAAMSHVTRSGWINRRKEYALAAGAVKQFAIVARAGVDQDVRLLSGGNQQKVVIAKWLANHPRVLILDEPTKGIDIAAKREVHELIRRFAAEGVSAILVSSEMDEVLALAHRVVVMRAGNFGPSMDTAEATRESLMRQAVFHEMGQ